MIGFETEPAEPQHVLVVHESGRRWVDALSGHAHGFHGRVRHSVSIQDTLAIVGAERQMTLLVELGGKPLEALELMERVDALGKKVTLIVVARSDQAQLELPARELGASAFLREPLTGKELASTVHSIVRLQLRVAQTWELG